MQDKYRIQMKNIQPFLYTTLSSFCQFKKCFLALAVSAPGFKDCGGIAEVGWLYLVEFSRFSEFKLSLDSLVLSVTNCGQEHGQMK